MGRQEQIDRQDQTNIQIRQTRTRTDRQEEKGQEQTYKNETKKIREDKHR